MGGIYFLISPTIGSDPGLNWTAIGVLVSAFAGFVTMGALIITWRIAYLDKKYRKSLFYLDKVNSYFSKAVTILSECKNNSVKWHQAINALKEADKLKTLLTDESHQSIYVADYIDAGYEISDIIRNIDDFRFFYGIADCKDKSASILYNEGKSSKISPEELLCLCKFVDKANSVFYDKNNNRAEPGKIFESDYFRKSLSDRHPCNTDILDLVKNQLKVIFKYIKDVEEHDYAARRKRMVQTETVEN